nr:MAG TPA: hypothetical protein [Caudoviricetes sp.]
MRLIDAELLEEQFGISDADILAKEEIRYAPTVDAEVVVRCKDCKHLVAVNVNGKGIPTCRMSGMEVAPAEFCSRGEKERRC